MPKSEPSVIRAAAIVAFGTLAVYAAYTCFGLGKPGLAVFFDKGVHSVLMLSSALIVFVRVVRCREQRGAWAAFGVGLLSYALGDLVYYLFLAHLKSPPYPSVADALWLGFYPAVYVGLVLLVRGRVRGFRASVWLDGLLGALTVAAVGAAVIFGSISASTGGAAAVVATNLAYPLGDVLLLGLVVGVFALTGWRPGRAWTFLGAGLAINCVVDAIYLYQASAGIYVPGENIDALWPLAALLVAFAAWQPQPRKLSEIRLAGWRTIALPTLFMLVAVGLETYDHFERLHPVALALASVSLVVATGRLGLAALENLRLLAHSRYEANTDALTDLGNRRRLLADLDAAVEDALGGRPATMMLFDLNGFKGYNDAFGHPAGDALLTRLGRSLEAAVEGSGRAYRMGGDEFCVIFHDFADAAATADALAETGDGFHITAAYGAVELPEQATSAAEALRLADQRLYVHTAGGRPSSRRQSGSVLSRALAERDPSLSEHLTGVADLAEDTARALGLSRDAVDQVRLAAELHDVGKMAIPDAILNKPSALDDAEWEFIRRHTLIGERILAAAPDLAGVAKLVRSSHERWDGHGYPDRLAGEDIAAGARIVSACDAFDAMTSNRPYRAGVPIEQALAELHRCAGTQFDPAVVDALATVIAATSAPPAAPAGSAQSSLPGGVAA